MNSPKLLLSLSLIPEGKNRLEVFLESNLNKLIAEDPDTKGELVALLKEVLPSEIMEELGNILRNRSDYVLRITNLPERRDAETMKDCQSSDFYAYHIGAAIYEIFGIQSNYLNTLKRSSHRMQLESDRYGTVAKHQDHMGPDFIIFSSPYNGEHAVTEFTHLSKAIDEVPEAMRHRVQVAYMTPGNRPEHLTLEQFRHKLANGQITGSNMFVLESDPAEEETRAFLEAQARHGCRVDIQPGDMIVICEDHIYHQGSPGDPAALSHIPRENTFSRIFSHHAGGTLATTQRK